MKIRLPDDPNEYQYEDLVSAALTAGGYFVETNLTMHGGNILEWDAVATPANGDCLDSVLVETKSGRNDNGIGEMFKLYGQATFTGIKTAWLVHKEPEREDNRAAIDEVEKGTCVTRRHVTKDALRSRKFPLPAAREMDENLRHFILMHVWWGRLADRQVARRFANWRKGAARTHPELAKKARDYCRLLDESFFKRSPTNRAHALYDAYKKHPQISQQCAEAHGPAREVVMQAWGQSMHYPVQYMMMQEQRARLRLLKNALDATFFPQMKKPHPGGKIDWGNLLKAQLPKAFHTGLDELEKHPTPYLVPYFFQVFVEGFGGFYFKDDRDDVELLSRVTGIEPDDLDRTLRLYDSFFPIEGSWLHSGRGGIVWLKTVPAYMRGVGCFLRGTKYSLKGRTYAYRFPESDHQMAGWHNALSDLLRPTLRVDEDT